MATMTMQYSAEGVVPVDLITIVGTGQDTMCESTRTIDIDPKTNASVYVEFTYSDLSEVEYTPTQSTISSVQRYSLSINTYQIPGNNGFANQYETTLGVNVYDSQGGTLLDSFEYSRLSVTGSECKPIVLDETPPVVTLIGSNPITVEVGSSFTDPGVTAVDNVDADVSGSLIVSGIVDVNTVGVYVLSYTAEDSAGNSTSITRTVNVVDTAIPSITLIGDSTVTIELGTSYVDQGATAVDAYDGDITSSIVESSNVDDSLVGTYSVTYNVTDSNNNNAIQVTRVVNVIDTNAPVITILGNNPIDVEIDTVYNDAGATADGGETVTSTGTVDTSVLGTYYITYEATDASNNTAIATRTVNVVDTSLFLIVKRPIILGSTSSSPVEYIIQNSSSISLGDFIHIDNQSGCTYEVISRTNTGPATASFYATSSITDVDDIPGLYKVTNVSSSTTDFIYTDDEGNNDYLSLEIGSDKTLYMRDALNPGMGTVWTVEFLSCRPPASFFVVVKNCVTNQEIIVNNSVRLSIGNFVYLQSGNGCVWEIVRDASSFGGVDTITGLSNGEDCTECLAV